MSDAPAAENAYLYNLDGTKQAISVTIKSFATGLCGKLPKLSGGESYDVLIPSDYMIERLIKEDYLQYIDWDLIPNKGSLMEMCIRDSLWRFNLHKTNAANEELVISLNYGRGDVYKRQLFFSLAIASLS